MTQAMLKDQASFIPQEKHRVIHQAVLNACDKLDGVEDGLIENPTRCRFDPAVLACRGADGPNCLTAAQLEAAKVVMYPVKNRRTGELIFPASSRNRARVDAHAQRSGPVRKRSGIVQVRIFKDPDWNWRTFDLERDLADCRKGWSRHAVGRRSEPDGIRRAWRQAPHVSRLERSEHRAAGERQLLHERARRDKGSRQRIHVVASVYGAWDGPLWRRGRAGHV